MLKHLLAIAALLFITSCTNEILTVHMDYISHANLASTYVGTPDPLLETPFVGQRLVVSWYVPVCYKDSKNFELHIRLRYGNKEEATAIIPFQLRQGWYVYALTNEEFFEKNGIKTYYVQLYSEGELIDHWQHQLWMELIQFNQEDDAVDHEADQDEEENEDDQIEIERAAIEYSK